MLNYDTVCVECADCSNSSWQEMEPLIIQSYQIYPVTSEVQQRLILSYLTPMGEYQEVSTGNKDSLIIELHLLYTHTNTENISSARMRLCLCKGICFQLLPEVFQNKAMDIVFHYLDYQNNIDVRLGFIAVRVRTSQSYIFW